jgi:hypothetical protein
LFLLEFYRSCSFFVGFMVEENRYEEEGSWLKKKSGKEDLGLDG